MGEAGHWISGKREGRENGTVLLAGGGRLWYLYCTAVPPLLIHVREQVPVERAWGETRQMGKKTIRASQGRMHRNVELSTSVFGSGLGRPNLRTSIFRPNAPDEYRGHPNTAICGYSGQQNTNVQ
jgi:hypothetical protein